MAVDDLYVKGCEIVVHMYEGAIRDIDREQEALGERRVDAQERLAYARRRLALAKRGEEPRELRRD